MKLPLTVFVVIILIGLFLIGFSVTTIFGESITPPPILEDKPAWLPAPSSTFQIQFTGEIDPRVDAQVFDLDAFDTDADTVRQLHNDGKHVICYINAGAVEDWRPDAEAFPAEVIGNTYAGWPGEHWLDIRALDALSPLLSARLDMCQEKGFDGVEFDNVDGWQNDTGFDLTAANQLVFDRWLADAAHQRDLTAGLKNDPDQIIELEPWFDFLILESCFEQGWCELAHPFTEAGKPVYAIEYSDITPWCEDAEEYAITLVGKSRELGAERQTCP